MDEQRDPEPLAAAAWDLLARCFDHDDPSGLTEALGFLREALVVGTGHPDEMWWRYGLGIGYGLRAEAGGAAADWDRAVESLTDVLRGRPHVDIDPDEVCVELAGLLIRRHDATPGAGDLDRLVSDLDAIPVPAGRSAGRAAVAVLGGLARLHRYTRDDNRADRDTAVGMLEAALPAVSDGVPLLAEALAAYADACAETGRFDAGLNAVSRARLLLDADDDPTDLDVSEAVLRDQRWMLADEPADRDRAIDCLDDVIAAGKAVPFALQRSGELLFFRGNAGDSVDDLDRAVRRLEESVRAGAHDPAVAWFFLGAAHQRRWELTETRADRERIVTCFGVALDHGLDESEMILMAHQHRVTAAGHRLDHDPGDAGAADAAAPVLAAARAALDEGAGRGTPERADLAMAMISLELGLAGRIPGSFDTARVTGLINVARRHPEPPAEWESRLGIAEATMRTYDDTMSGGRGDFGLGLMPGVVGSSAHAHVFGPLVGIAALIDAIRSGDQQKLTVAARLLRAEDGSPTTHLVAGYAELAIAHGAGAAPEELRARVHELLGNARAAAASDPGDRWVADYMLPLLHALQSAIDPAGALPPSFVPGTPAAVDPLSSVLAGAVAAVRSAAAVTARSGDRAGQRQALLDVEQEAAAFPPGSPQRGFTATILAEHWLHHSRDRLDGDAAERAVRWSEESIAAAGGPENPLWAPTALVAAEAHRVRNRPGDRVRGRELGLAALRGRAWLVLLQSATEHGMTMARSAAQEALRVARWCAEDRALDDLVVALDAGRGLVLHAAITTRTVAEQLRALGRPELADEWSRSGGDERLDLGPDLAVDLPGDLRSRVLSAVTVGPASLLDPPSPDRIRAALRAHGSDALIYLVPGSTDHPGMAVIVPAADQVEVLELPALTVDEPSPLPGYADAYERWHAMPPTATGAQRRVAFETWRAALGHLTEWAWDAAAARISDAAPRWSTGSDRPRLTLVPVGLLALVPWHATRPAGGAAATVLAAGTIISYIPSARLLCECVTRRRSPRDGPALIVGNPTGGLVAAGDEAQALRTAFYPHATYLGRPGTVGGPGPSGPASAAAVLKWLDEPAARRSVLHLACHAVAEPAEPGRTRVRLDDGDLAVEELLAHRRTKLLGIERVFLAACSTNVSGVDYDEAFSIATAFLAAGARTAYGSMWTVPDAYTSRSMFMIHHHLEVDGCSPAEALHRAQRWALDPRRVAPATMPAHLVAGGHGGLPADDPVAWAGFMHLGV